MIRAWNKNIGQHFHSFHLEILALQILDKVTISDFPSGMRYFFDKGREKIKFQTAEDTPKGANSTSLWRQTRFPGKGAVTLSPPTRVTCPKPSRTHLSFTAKNRPWVNPWWERERRGRFLASAASTAN
jgi:hypothetical protein